MSEREIKEWLTNIIRNMTDEEAENLMNEVDKIACRKESSHEQQI